MDFLKNLFKNKKFLIAASAVLAAIILVVALVLLIPSGKGPDTPNNSDPTGGSTIGGTTPSGSTPSGSDSTQSTEGTPNTMPVDPSVKENCEAALTDYLSTVDANTSTDGLIIYSKGEYFAVIDGKLYAPNADNSGNAKIVKYTYAGAGENVLPAIATFRNMPCVERSSGGAQVTTACNYYLEASVGDTAYYINFFLDGGSTPKNPQFISLYNKDDVQITRGVAGQIFTETSANKPVKNVIYMIADGGGYDNYTLAEKVKEEMLEQGKNKLAGAKTEVTTDKLAGIGKSNVNGLYLDELLVGSANTLLLVPHGDENDIRSYITDSSAAGTALSSGYKTTYRYAGIDSNGVPRASIVELARINGMATGLVTTKSYVDATPLAFFTAHSIDRHQYQDNSMQALMSGIDVLIAEGTEYGDMCEETYHPNISATSMGYTVARNKTQMIAKANDASTKKLWAPILGVTNSTKVIKRFDEDTAADHITYDIDAAQSAEQPSLLEMTQSALQVLGNNVNDPDGFFLMVEGGALDNAAEGGHLRDTVGEYLAFDEAFGYCVNWAAARGDTIVIAVPDHDSGGFSGIEDCEDALINGIISGSIGNKKIEQDMSFSDLADALEAIGEDTDDMELFNGHSDMAVPISLYAPQSVKTELLKSMTLPTTAGEIRKGNSEYYVENQSGSFTWYSSSALNNDYTIDNTKIAPAIADILDLGSLDYATGLLFNEISSVSAGQSSGSFGGSVTFADEEHSNNNSDYLFCSYANSSKGLSVDRNSTSYTLNGSKQENTKIGNLLPSSLFVLKNRNDLETGRFYVPYNILTATNQAWSITITSNVPGYSKILTATGTGSITLPQAASGQQIIYTDGTRVYNPGDTIAYSSTPVNLTAYVK